MRGIILAAGRGSRLCRETDDRPKCMVELSGRPLLHWQLNAMRKAGIERILVVRGYRGEMVTGEFITCDNPRWQQTNMVASLMCAGDWLKEEPCIVSYADIVYGSKAVTELMQAPEDLVIMYDTNWVELWQKRFADPLSDAESFYIDDKGFIKDIGRKGVTLNDIHGQYMGLLKFTPGSAAWVYDLLEKNQELCDSLDMTGLLSRLIKVGYPIKGLPWNGAWCEIDNRSDMVVAEQMIKDGELILDV